MIKGRRAASLWGDRLCCCTLAPDMIIYFRSRHEGKQRKYRSDRQKRWSLMDENTGGVRLNKFLSDSGICSRREADRRIETGDVLVDGKPAVMGMKVFPGQTVVFCGKPVGEKDRPVLLAVHKPRGIVCTTSDKDRAENIVDFLHYPVRVYPVGRLDKDSDGLILMTNRGELVNEILRARNGHEKEYEVTVNRLVTGDFIRKMASGVEIGDEASGPVKTRPCQVTQTGMKSFRIVLTQGLNRQIRRMCRALGYEVVTLTRIRIMNIKLEDLPAGQYREVSGEELEALEKLLHSAE